MTSTYDCPNWHLSACGWWFKRLFNSRDETALHSELGRELPQEARPTGLDPGAAGCAAQIRSLVGASRP